MKSFFRLAIIFWCASVAMPASAADTVSVAKVQMSSADTYVEFAFHLNAGIEPARLTARTDGTLLVFTLAEATTARSWIKSTNKHVRRVLLHPVKDTNHADLRVRYFKPVSGEMLSNIRVRNEGNLLIAAVPNTTAVAKQWASHAEVTSKTDPQSIQKGAEQTKSESENDEEAIAISPDSMQVDENLLPSTEAASGSGDEAEAGVAATERSGTPLLIVAAFLMLGVGFVLFKKMRQMKPAAEGGPLIRPIGTHMLGPKQGLLLVDVAGEMVLLGTTDKGVQLLTKLDGDRLHESTDTTSTSNDRESAVVPSQQAENPFGRMLGQFREASARLRGASKSTAKQAANLEELSLLAGDSHTYDRRQFRAVTPKTPVPPYETQPSLQERDALIEKLRMLKGA